MRARVRTSATAIAIALVAACGGDSQDPTDADMPFVQPGEDDPTARPMAKHGAWYPADHEELDAAVMELIDAAGASEVRPARAILTPHASLKFSGPTAAEVFARVQIPDRVITLAPDHWTEGPAAGIWTEGPWLVPGHAIAVDDELVADLWDALPDLVADPEPFSHHETEMQLPFLQFLHPDVAIAPIAIFDNSRNHFKDFDVERIEAWGVAIADVIRRHTDAGEDVLLLTTTDLVHHETLAVADEHDPAMLEYVAALDVQGLYDYVTANEVSVCGEIPTAIMMVVVRELGGTGIEIIARGNSLHANGDENDIIGYPAAAAWSN